MRLPLSAHLIALCSVFLLGQGLCAQPANADGTGLEAHYAAAKRALAQQDYEKAVREWNAIVRLAPGMAEAHSNLGMMYYFARKPEAAIEPFREALRLSPKLVAPHLFLGICYYLVSRPADAVAELRRTLELEPHNAAARQWLGLTYLFNGDLLQAVSTLKQALGNDPDNSEIVFGLARAYGRLSVDSLKAIRNGWPDSAWDHVVRADQYTVQGRSQDAARHWDEAQRLDPEACRLARAAAEQMEPPFQPGLIRRADYEQAYTHAVRLRSRDGAIPETLYLLAAASRGLAAARIEAFARMEPNSHRLSQLRAEFEEARENHEAAEAHYRAVLAAKPDALHIHLALGRLHDDRRQFNEAITEYRKELDIDPYSTAALTRIGRAYRYLQENDRAIEFLKRSLDIDATSIAAHKELGIVYLQAGSTRLSIQHLERANLLSNGADDAVHYQLSRAYRSAGQTELATKYLDLYREKLRLNRERTGKPTEAQ